MALSTFSRLTVAGASLACGAFALQASAQSGSATTQLTPVTVNGRAAPIASVSGWGDIPLADTPVQATVLRAEQLRDAGVSRLSDLTALDPAVSDAYNAEGYYDYLTVRGFVLDNRFNFRRDGLPINAESSIPLENKSSLEVLKGISGMQAGTSAPGGLVDYVVKRPTEAPIRSAFLEWRQPGTVTGSVDLGQRFGVDRAFGVRLNAAAAHLDPMVRDSRGNRNLFALAADWRLGADTLLEAEFETSHRSQPSQPGFSMLGATVPSAGDPRINLNDQPWSLPVVFDARTASLRWQQRLAGGWRFVAHAMAQRLKTNDRLAYPFGCSKEGHFDRYCSDGTFDFYDFHSDDEHRDSDALQLSLEGKASTGSLVHRLALGILETRFRSRLQPQVDDNMVVGTGSVDGLTIIPTLPALGNVPNTNRSEHSTELSLRDAVALTERLTVWLGARHTALSRDSVLTDGTEPTGYNQSFTTPFAAASYAFRPGQLVYASWGQGVESEVAPNRSLYSNAGRPLPSLKSRQTEVGVKGSTGLGDAGGSAEWSVGIFDIVRPLFADFGICDGAVPGICSHEVDGTQHHRGIEGTVAARVGPWAVDVGTQWLHARVEGSRIAANDGLEPTNVPARTWKVAAAYDVATLPGLRLQANAMNESRRMVLPDNSASIPSVTRVDAGLRYLIPQRTTRWTVRAGVDNVFDRRAWLESPYEFSHVYLYPLAPRTARLSLEAGW